MTEEVEAEHDKEGWTFRFSDGLVMVVENRCLQWAVEVRIPEGSRKGSSSGAGQRPHPRHAMGMGALCASQH
jgi:hypothetical protein